MAKKKTSTTKADANSQDVVDTEIVEDAGDTTEDDPTSETPETAVEEVEPRATEDEVPEEDTPTADDEIADTPAEETVEDEASLPEEVPAAPVDPVVKTETIVERKGGFVPMLLGGVAAGAIGFGAAYYVLPNGGGEDAAAFRQGITDQVETQSDAIAGLSDQIAALPETPDLSGVTAAQADLSAVSDSLATRLDNIETSFSDMEGRLTNLEKAPIAEGASDAAVAAYERELKALQDAMAAQRAEIEAMAEEAHSMEASAQETALATMRRAALTRIQTALDTGTGFAPALTDLETAGVAAPAVLSDVSTDGVPSLAQLQESFPDAARKSLTDARNAAAQAGEESGFSTFLKNKLGTRSLEPREGDDPDAVLSRAEAAVKDGRLTDALAEIDALPDAGQAALVDWKAQAQLRQDAVAAAEALGEELN